jgi:hypothetical protein
MIRDKSFIVMVSYIYVLKNSYVETLTPNGIVIGGIRWGPLDY